MRAEEKGYLIQLKILLDSILIGASFFCVYYFRKQMDLPYIKSLAPVSHYLWILIFSYPLWWISLIFLKVYSSRRLSPGPAFFRFAGSGFVVLLVLALFLFISQVRDANRTLVLPFLVLSVICLYGWRMLVAIFFPRLTPVPQILVVGEGTPLMKLAASDAFRDLLLSSSVQCVIPETEPRQFEWKVIGRPDELPGIFHDTRIDEVILAVPFSKLHNYEQYLRISETMGIQASLFVDLYEPDVYQMDIDSKAGFPFLTFCVVHDPLGMFLKHLLDRCLALLLLILFAPIFILVGILIKMTSSGPVFYTHDRAGLHGLTFRMYKFRTMKQDAARERDLLAAANEMDGPVFKIKNDPRVTSIGKYLRKYSLDELPQLYNVLKGEMSLVGPRPLPVYETDHIRYAYRRRLYMRPGITCTWQANGRNRIPYEEWMRLDLEYIQNWSLWLDFKILLRTIWIVFTTTGAS